GLGRERRRALRARSLALSRLGAAGGLQRGPLREARGTLGGRSRRGGRAPARRRCVEHPDHVPHGPAARRPRHAAGRVPARDRELLGSRGGGARARAADEDVPRGGRRRCGRGRAVKVVTAFPRPVRRIEHCWIPLPDGCRLAARLWLPEDADTSPVPAIVEYIPYRKRDFTRARDEPMHHYFAGHGYAAVRVDVRGAGESDGVLLDEYSEQELGDGVAVIDWIASQPWCTGAVGMIGKSWGGFNVLQIAARRPPALRAVITVCGSDDRYADDAHYMGGCLLNENLTWGSVLLASSGLPPDRALGSRLSPHRRPGGGDRLPPGGAALVGQMAQGDRHGRARRAALPDLDAGEPRWRRPLGGGSDLAVAAHHAEAPCARSGSARGGGRSRGPGRVAVAGVG